MLKIIIGLAVGYVIGVCLTHLRNAKPLSEKEQMIRRLEKVNRKLKKLP